MSDLVGNPEDRFSHGVAEIIPIVSASRMLDAVPNLLILWDLVFRRYTLSDHK